MSALKKVLIFTACVEVVTGLALLIVPIARRAPVVR